MACSFPVQGYGLLSIILVTLYIFLSYLFIFLVVKDLRKKEWDYSVPFLKASLFFLFLSSLGTWALAVMMASAMKGTVVYYGAIQFYLHFQFNGWLIFGILALFLKLLVRWKVQVNMMQVKMFFRLMVLSTLLTFALAITWSTPIDIIFWMNSAGVLIQLAALVYFINFSKKLSSELERHMSKEARLLFYMAAISFILKIGIQTFVCIPAFAVISYTIRNFIVGFIHLLLLGCISMFLIGLMQHLLGKKKKISPGISIFIIGIVLSEFLLFLQGLMLWFSLGFIPNYYHWLLAASILLLTGLMLYFIQIMNIGHRINLAADKYS